MQIITNNNASSEASESGILLSAKEKAHRLRYFLCSHLLYVAVLAAIFLLCLLVGCAAPKTVYEHHHHHYEADTAAVRAAVDSRMSSWHAEMQSVASVAVSQQLTQQQQQEHQQEIITETITVSLDSLGREVRQEQRTISRDITRELRQQEQRITQEYEQRLHRVVDSLSAVWSQCYDSLAAHVEQLDSTSAISHQPSAIDHRPWYQRLWDHVKWLVVGAVLAAILYFTRKWKN